LGDIPEPWKHKDFMSDRERIQVKLARRILAVLFMLLPFACLMAQELPPPGGIKLLPGYHHEIRQGIDSIVGIISRPGGLEIQYDIGEMAGDYTACATCGWTKGEIWRKVQVVNGQRMVCVFTKDKRLVVSFPQSRANFYATIHGGDELADMLLMMATFQRLPRTAPVNGSPSAGSLPRMSTGRSINQA
jgi:hypothetical protein